MTFEIGSTAYIVESNRIIREVTIVKRNGNFYIIRFGTRGGIQVSVFCQALFPKKSVRIPCF